MSYEVFDIEYDRHSSVATLWHNNPARRNAMGPAFWNELPAAIGELARAASVRAIVLAARGRDFSVGLDLKAMTGPLSQEGGSGRRKLFDEIQRVQGSITVVADCPKPVVAALHGYCLGGGVDLCPVCDVRYAAADTIPSIRETRMAMSADPRPRQRLRASVGN